MDLFLILLIIAVISLYFAPFMLDSIKVSFPVIMPILKVKNTVIFGIVGILFSHQIEPFPILNVFIGMIAGSFIDFLIRK